MANIKSAQKKARKDVRKSSANKVYIGKIDKIVNTARKVGYTPQSPELNAAYSLIDKASKRKIISKQKAARLKSSIS
ncbi:MAG: 30S ribosomal protein S20 [Candidatus Roizmanbacteria bacterium]